MYLVNVRKYTGPGRAPTKRNQAMWVCKVMDGGQWPGPSWMLEAHRREVDVDVAFG